MFFSEWEQRKLTIRLLASVASATSAFKGGRAEGCERATGGTAKGGRAKGGGL